MKRYIDLPCVLRVTFDDKGEAENYWPLATDCDGIELPLQGGFVQWLEYDRRKALAGLLLRHETEMGVLDDTPHEDAEPPYHEERIQDHKDHDATKGTT